MLNLLVNIEEGYVAVEKDMNDMAGYAPEVALEVLNGTAGTEVSLEDGLKQLEDVANSFVEDGVNHEWSEMMEEFMSEIKDKTGRFMKWSVEETMDVNLMFIEG